MTVVSHKLSEQQKRFFSQLAFWLSRVIWVFFAVVAITLMLVFSWYFWDLATTSPCSTNNCSALLTWLSQFGFGVEVFAVLYLISFVVPVLIWLAVAFWIYLSQPHQLWSVIFSLFFLIGWYSEVSLQYLRGSMPLAMAYTLESVGLQNVFSSQAVIGFSEYLRGILKVIADNLLVLVVFAFPNGRLYPFWSRYYLLFFALLSVGYSLPFLRETTWNYARLDFPWNVAINFLLLLGLLWGALLRFRQSSDAVQQQVRSIFPIVIVSVFVYFLDLLIAIVRKNGGFSSQEMQSPVLQPLLDLLLNYFNSFTMIWLAVAVAQAIVRQQLFDIRFVLNRALAYSTLVVSLAVIYGLIIGGLGSLFRQTDIWLSIVATGVVAVLFHPLLVIFRQTANRLFYGERHDPYRAISNLGRQLEGAHKPEELAFTIVQTLASTLRLPYVALQPSAGQIVAVGSAVGQILEFPMRIKQQPVGVLLVSQRSTTETFTPIEMRLLEDLAARAAVAVQEALLTQEVQSSKEAIVFAREEERKRIRRDLHDGLGATLASVSMNLQVSKNLIGQNPARAETMIAASAQSVQTAITDIRRLVYDLRPPALDNLGLEGALRQQLGQMLVVIPEIHIVIFEPLPAAIEVAVYRITSEALNNIAKHANAKHVKFNLYQDQTGLLLEIADDGVGLPALPESGLGLYSMRERATELGGKFELESGQGTRVLAWLPVKTTGETDA